MTYEDRLALEAALLLKRGQPLPVDLETEMMNQGFDMPAFYSKHEL